LANHLTKVSESDGNNVEAVFHTPTEFVAE